MAAPVNPVTSVLPLMVCGRPSSCAVRAVIAERLAPVSSTSRYGPLPSIITGAQIHPMRSRRVGATNFGSLVSTITSESSSAGLATPGDEVCAPGGEDVDASGVVVELAPGPFGAVGAETTGLAVEATGPEAAAAAVVAGTGAPLGAGAESAASGPKAATPKRQPQTTARVI